MAEVPTVNGPRVAPSGAPLNVSAPAAAFGAGVLGAGLKEVGGALGQGANVLASHALAIQDMNNKAASDVGYSAFAAGANDLQSKFTALRGQDASAALPQFQADINSLREKIAGGMNPAAATYFNQETRRIEAGMFASARSHADTQQLDYLKVASNAKIVGAQQLWSANPTDENLLEFLGVAREEYSHQAHLALGETADPSIVSAFVADKVSETFAKTLTGLSGDNPIAAWNIAQAHGDLLRGDDKRVIGNLRRAAIPQMQALDADAKTHPLASGAVVPSTQPPATGPHAGADPASVVASLRQNAAGFIKSLTGIDVAITSAGRTAAENARIPGSSPTSEHLTNQAWDMVPTHGQSMVQLAQAINASGIPYDQLEVTPTHVHIGLRDSNLRRQIIGPLAGQVGGNAPGVPPNSVQFRAGLDDALAQVEGAARLRFPDDAQAGDRAVYEQGLRQAIISRMSQHYDSLRDNEANTTAGLLDYIDKNNVTDATQLPPQLRSQMDALPPQTAHIAQTSMTANSRQVTPEQQADVDELRGKFAVASGGGDPQPFLSADIPSMNLPPRVASAYMAKQAKMRAHQGAVSAQGVNSVMASTPFHSALDDYGIEPNSSQYWQFVGRVHEAVDEFTKANGDKPPTPKEYPAIVAGVVAQGATGGVFGLGATAASVIPQADFDAINRELRAAGMTPSIADIGYIYQRRHGNGGR